MIGEDDHSVPVQAERAENPNDSKQTPHQPGITDAGQEVGRKVEGRETELGSESPVPPSDKEIKSCGCGNVEEDTKDGPGGVEYTGGGVPIDRGWAWVVAFSCFLIVFVFSSMGQVVATLLSDILEAFDISVSVISTTLSVGSLARCLTTMMAANVLLPRMSIRVMVTVAAIINAACTFAIVAFPSVIVFCGALFIKELSKGFTVISSLTLVGHYFQRHRGLATAFGLIGFSVCSAVVPPFIRYLKDELGFTAAFLLFGGVEMQAIVVGLLLRPISSYKRKEIGSTVGKYTEVEYFENELILNPDQKAKGLDLTSGDAVFPIDTKEQGDIELEEKETLLHNHDTPNTQTIEARTEQNISLLYQVDLNKDKDLVLQPKCDLSDLPIIIVDSSLSLKDPTPVNPSTVTSLPKYDGKSNEDVSKKCCTVPEHCLWLKEMVQMFNPALFKHYVCLVLCTSYSLNICAAFVLMYLPTYAQSVGVSKPDSASLLTIAGVVELIGRLVSGLLGDRKWLRPGTIIAMSSMVIFVTCQLAGILLTFWSLAGFAMVVGFLGCFGQNLMSLLIVDTLGLDSLASVLAMGSLFGAVSFALAHAIHGVLIELTGGFLASFSLTGVGFLVGGILLFCLPLVKRLQNKKDGREAEAADDRSEAHSEASEFL
ncbi:monocarboxylate transporter 5 [Elysia marginata]|uniref:Monocarboxylate transporter 5 n=1 Tax=Elysia marginata TaxID=1093978 RepID=A0AAV4F1Y6_9GAST|nr:monocarboxylate transporter 5 [Elysia marginata]